MRLERPCKRELLRFISVWVNIAPALYAQNIREANTQRLEFSANSTLRKQTTSNKLDLTVYESRTRPELFYVEHCGAARCYIREGREQSRNELRPIPLGSFGTIAVCRSTEYTIDQPRKAYLADPDRFAIHIELKKKPGYSAEAEDCDEEP